MMRIERMTSPLPRECSTTEPHGLGYMERVKGIEPSSGAWKASALPLSYTRAVSIFRPCSSSIRLLSECRWWGMDSNHRRRKPTDLQSAPFSHSGTPPEREIRIIPYFEKSVKTISKILRKYAYTRIFQSLSKTPTA